MVFRSYVYRAALKGTNLRGQTPICGFLRVPAGFCDFFSAKICVSQKLCFLGKGENLEKSAKLCERVRFVPLGFSQKILMTFQDLLGRRSFYLWAVIWGGVQNVCRSAQKGDSKWQKPVSAKNCGFLRKSAVSCGFLRKSAQKKSLDLQSEPKISENLQKSAKMCVPGPVSPFCCLPFGAPWVWGGGENVPKNALSRRFLEPSKRASVVCSVVDFCTGKTRALTLEGGGKRTIRGGGGPKPLFGKGVIREVFHPPLFSTPHGVL